MEIMQITGLWTDTPDLALGRSRFRRGFAEDDVVIEKTPFQKFRRVSREVPPHPDDLRGRHSRRIYKGPIWSSYTTAHLQGFRIADNSLTRYELFLGTDAQPDFTAAPVATSATLPFHHTIPELKWPTAKNASIIMNIPFNDSASPVTAVVPAGKEWASNTNLVYGAAGLLGKALRVTGPVDLVTVMDVDAPGPGKMSFSIWLNLEGNPIVGLRELIRWEDWDGNLYRALVLYVSFETIVLEFYEQTVTPAVITDHSYTAAATIPTTGSHLLTVVTNPASAKFYLDAVEITNTLPVLWSGMSEAVWTPALGCSLISNKNSGLTLGLREQLIIWDDRLTAAEVAAIYNNGEGVIGPPAAPGVGNSVLHAIVRKRNQYGLMSLNQFPVLFEVVNATGVEVLGDLTAPVDTTVMPDIDLGIVVAARYLGKDKNEPNTWQVFVGVGTIPNPLTDAPTYEIDMVSDGVGSTLNAKLGPYAEGAVLNVIAAVYRTEDNTQSSAAAVQYTMPTMPVLSPAGVSMFLGGSFLVKR